MDDPFLAIVLIGMLGTIANQYSHLTRPHFTLAQIMAILVSVAVLGSALYVILHGKYPVDTLRWAYSAVGFVFGYWITPPKG
ncbi:MULTISPECIES: hypothetical protein [unclassified Mesorhizobium]|uniref:hypothetical protein n=1 Tax=unclassified Mesorhizobium TaxID=325217 RepID=UPI001092E0C5|nr:MULTISPECIES: hypothetical protein [unclassified Mesorhizobium]TGQ43675.1 hypothetical protein EN857_06180 [Mesorhizobium sp. M4B.F.Ca.ET.214.01.1.1]TGQ62490.1 hypothetical protein EN854_06185 [Mesorhizobium sp. M4B.F.Ca.ET.211.01.1.1]TGU39692.1 hypothetical protein EN793_06180 [Mesorhizobium sp. M4B.F.Ca.ET.150.01.1.1]TIX14844.1 MAG: hypothetical protein E5V46_07420 [Mesorhizobium sp.]